MTITQQLSEINPNKSSFFLSRPGETLLPRSSPLLFRPYLQHSTLPDKTMPPGLARPNEKTGADKSKIREKGGGNEQTEWNQKKEKVQALRKQTKVWRRPGAKFLQIESIDRPWGEGVSIDLINIYI